VGPADGGASEAAPSPASTIEAGGIAIACRDRGGDGTPILCLHETAASAAVWEPFAEEVGAWARPIAYDRRGWGASGAPEGYRGTTISEHAEDAAALLAALAIDQAMVCGAGIGALIALELMLRADSAVSAALLIEPPLLSLLPEMTEGLAADREKISAAVASGGRAAAVELYLSGGLLHLGPGQERIPRDGSASAADHPISLFAELAAVAAWPLRGREMLAVGIPSRIVVGASTPPVVRQAGEGLAALLGGSEIVRLGGEGLPHVSAAAGLAASARSLR